MIEVSSFLSGKNLCNIFADLIVKEINKVSPNATTEISVINVGSFFVVKGSTSSKTVVDLTKIIKQFYSDFANNFEKTIKIFDFILYNTKLETKNLNINLLGNINDIFVYNDFQKICNIFQNDGHSLTMKIDSKTKNILYDVEGMKIFNQKILEKMIGNYNLVKSSFFIDTYISDKFFGLSNENLKYYYVLLNKIVYNLLTRGFCNKIDISLSSNVDFDKMNNDNISLKISNNLFKNDTLENLILDNFSFVLSDLKNEFDLNNLNLINTIKNQDPKIWENYHKTKDLMFL